MLTKASDNRIDCLKLNKFAFNRFAQEVMSFQMFIFDCLIFHFIQIITCSSDFFWHNRNDEKGEMFFQHRRDVQVNLVITHQDECPCTVLLCERQFCHFLRFPFHAKRTVFCCRTKESLISILLSPKTVGR